MEVVLNSRVYMMRTPYYCYFLHQCLADFLQFEGLCMHSGQSPAWCTCLDFNHAPVDTLQLNIGASLSHKSMVHTMLLIGRNTQPQMINCQILWSLYQLLHLTHVDPPVARPSINQVWFTQWSEVPSPSEGGNALYLHLTQWLRGRRFVTI